MSAQSKLAWLLGMLEKNGVITSNPKEKEKCCGIERDSEGYCQHRPDHPIYFNLLDD